MSDEQRSVALERVPRQVPITAGLISDDEVRRMYRIAEALALSGSFKGINKAEQAFAKMIVGRDFGMSPAQSMLGLHLVEGSVMVHYAMLGQFIRARADEGYGYRHGWIRETSPVLDPDNTTRELHPRVRDFIWADEDDPADMREIVGASVEFHGEGGDIVGISTFTKEDAIAAGKIKPEGDPRAAWNTSRRNMFLARAMSNGVKWFVPEVMGGLPIYVEGEIVETPSVTDPVGTGGDEGTGIDLGPRVEAIISRAEELGHRGLNNRGAIEMAVGNRAPGIVNQWVKDATAELDQFEAAREEVADAVVVDPVAEAEKTALGGDESLKDQVEGDRTVEKMEETVLRNRLQKLAEARADEQDPEQRALIDEEVEHINMILGEEAEGAAEDESPADD